MVVESSGDTQLTRPAPLRPLAPRNTRGIYARPNALLHSGITQALGRHLSQHDLRASTHGTPSERSNWKSPVYFSRCDRGSGRAIDHHGKPFARDGASFQVPKADHAAPSVTFLCSRSYRPQSNLSFYEFLGTSTIPRRRSSAGRNLSDRLHRQAWHTMMPSPYPESTRKNSIRSGLSCAHKRARTRPVVFAPACR